MKYGLLLDSGYITPLKVRTLAQARETLARHNCNHRIATYCRDLAIPRLAVGLVKFKKKAGRVFELDDRRYFCRNCGRARWMHHYRPPFGFLCDDPPKAKRTKR